MVLGGRSLFAVALDARQPSLWTGVIARVQGVLVWSLPLCSGSSPRTSGMPVWWVPCHVARSRVCAPPRAHRMLFFGGSSRAEILFSGPEMLTCD
eukprot:scaffold85519_cov38-Phaeocystis_antarctica.AAC.2